MWKVVGLKTAVVTLEGGHSDVIAVAQAAAKAIAVDGSVKQALCRELWVLHQGRSALAGWPKVATARGTILWQAVWGVFLSTGLLAALTAAVMFGPAGRKNASISAEQAASVALPAAQIGIVLIAVMLFLPVPARPAARYGSVVTMVVGLVIVGLFAFRIVSGTADERGFTSGQVALWLPAIALILVLLALLAWRLDVMRRRVVGHGRVLGPRARMEQGRHLRAMAERLAGTASPRLGPAASNAVLKDWNSRLEQLERKGITPAAIAQARQMGPAAWLVWVFYNGNIDVSGVLPR